MTLPNFPVILKIFTYTVGIQLFYYTSYKCYVVLYIGAPLSGPITVILLSGNK